MPEITPLIAGLGVIAGAVLGYVARGLFVPAQLRAAEKGAWRQIEFLQRARAIEDQRNDTPLSKPISR
ncbi:hypothetical protein OKA04_04570 [Luteolibacter flavescens]|uniref:Uncharacterized protein n=1 Tax=Luteolibacter flavescens TaxID=1859460 RepID=A0ABT3FLZ5_9BACT|nr:hypothetical protein [Luteolibacter flavescens]MCW1883990.1 hypothetical protein [Luteolibacter flavescens]